MESAAFQAIHEELEALFDHGRAGAVERVARRALRDADEEQSQSLWCYVHMALRFQGLAQSARDAAERCGLSICRGRAALDVWDLEAAARFAQQAVEDGADDPSYRASGVHLQAILAEHAGQDATRLYEEAAQLDPDLWKVPPPLSERTAREICLTTLRSLPRPLRKALKKIPVYVLDLPRDRRIPPGTLGCYFHSHIEVYRLNIARGAESEMEAREQIRLTLLHEIGHAYGMEHDQLDKLGL